MRIATLSYYDLKRLLKNRVIAAVVLAIPIVFAIVRASVPAWRPGLVAAWICPVICAAFLWVFLSMQSCEDRASGFWAGLCATPISSSGVLASKIIAGFAAFAIQMSIFAAILLLRF